MCATLSSIRSSSDVPFIIPVDMAIHNGLWLVLLTLMADAEGVETAEIRFDDDEDVMMNKTGGYI
jgi:hypothetical protein